MVLNRRRIVAALAIVNFASVYAMVIMAPLLTQLGAEFGVTTGTAGLTVAAFTIPGFVVGLIVGPLADRYGKQRFLVAGSVLTGVSTLFAALAPTFEILLLTRVAAGFGAAVLTSSIGGVIGDIFPYKERGRMFAVTYGANALSNVIGVPLGGLIAEATSWRVAVTIVGAISIAGAVAVYAWLPRRTSSTTATASHTYLRIVRDRSAVALLLATALGAMMQWTWATYIVVYFQQTFGLSQGLASTFALTSGVGVLVGSQIGGRLGDRLGSRSVLLVAGMSASVVLVVLTSAPLGLAAATGANLLLMTVLGARSTAQAAVLTTQVPEARTTYMALAGALSSGAIALAAAIGGRLVDSYGFALLGAIGALAGLAGVALIAALVDERGTQAPPVALTIGDAAAGL